MIYTKYYFKTDRVKVKDAEISDVFALSPNLREKDKREIWKSHHHTSEAALLQGFTNSVLCFTVERNEKPICIFGVVPDNLIGEKGFIWLLASPELAKIKKAFLVNSPKFIDIMLEHYPLLFNYVDICNTESIKWLEWCGAEFGVITPYGAEKELFQYFQFRRK